MVFPKQAYNAQWRPYRTLIENCPPSVYKVLWTRGPSFTPFATASWASECYILVYTYRCQTDTGCRLRCTHSLPPPPPPPERHIEGGRGSSVDHYPPCPSASISSRGVWKPSGLSYCVSDVLRDTCTTHAVCTGCEHYELFSNDIAFECRERRLTDISPVQGGRVL